MISAELMRPIARWRISTMRTRVLNQRTEGHTSTAQLVMGAAPAGFEWSAPRGRCGFVRSDAEKFTQTQGPPMQLPGESDAIVCAADQIVWPCPCTSAEAAGHTMTPNPTDPTKRIFWHRELPPISAELLGEHVVEAVSTRVPNTFSHRDDLWDRCYAELMDAAQRRLMQEISRLGGDCAHVLREAVDTRHDDISGESWLHGRFIYVLYRLPKAAA